MTFWSARTSDGGYGLEIETSAWHELHRICTAAGDIETGGVLVGRYSTDLLTAVVIEVTGPPKDSRQGSSSFHRGVAGLRGILLRRWLSRERTHYIGEWHFHPAAHIEPSGDDVAQMYRIRDDLNYHCSEPILLILGKLGEYQERVARAFVFPRGKEYMVLEGTKCKPS